MAEVPTPSAQQDVHASLGKSLDHLGGDRLVDDRVGRNNQPPADTRSIEDVSGTDPAKGLSIDALLADPAKLETMSEKDIAKAMGLDTADKSDGLSPEGDGVVYDIDAALANGSATERTAETPAPAAAAPAAAPAAVTPPASTPAAATDPDVFVEGKNGTGKIRYEVLQNTRTRLQESAAENAALRAELEAARAGKPAAAVTEPPAAAAPVTPPAKAVSAAPVVRLYSEEEITKLRERFDDSIVEDMVMNRTAAVYANDRVNALEAQLAERDRDVVHETVQDMIDDDPVLSVWQSSKPGTPEHDRWQEALAQDELLKVHPAWRGKPWQERVPEAARRARTIFGDPEPTSGTPAPNTPATPSLSEKAAAAIKAANGTVTLPATHSDLPAGVAPAQSETESVAAMSNQQLERLFAGLKNPEDIAAYLTRIG